MSESICAVVVTYNRKELLIECLEALLKQTRPIQGIYLIDNASTDGTERLLFEKGYINELPPENLKEPWEREFEVSNLVDGNVVKIHYVRMNENTGGAGGFHEGVKRGYERGYDWLWLMDDDAEPKVNALNNLLLYSGYQYYVLTCFKVDPGGFFQSQHRGYLSLCGFKENLISPVNLNKLSHCDYVEITHSSFVGLLINRVIVEKIGYPLKEFFIYYDDVEYCIRIKSYGYKIIMPKNSIIVHKEKSVKKNYFKTKKFLIFNSVRMEPYFFLRFCYSIRNFTYLKRKNCSFLQALLCGVLFFFARKIFGIVLFDDNKLKRIRILFRAIFDGLNERLTVLNEVW